MKERPILFSGSMVRAILAGTKTQTRRVATKMVRHPDFGNFCMPGALRLEGESQNVIERACPYGQTGDRLWVRESTRQRWMLNILTGEPTNALCGEYTADDAPVLNKHGFDLVWWYSRPSCPSIHMPRAASRITLEITGVRIQRLQDISEADCIAEGIQQLGEKQGWATEVRFPDGKRHFGASAYDLYRQLWERINGVGSWGTNPWVWVVEFRRHE